MFKCDLERLRTNKWKEINEYVISIECMAKNMSNKQKSDYRALYNITIDERIRALKYILLNEKFNKEEFLNKFPSSLLNDVVFMKDALLLHPNLIFNAGEDVINNYDIGYMMVSIDGIYLHDLGKELKNNKDIVRKAVEEHKYDFTITSVFQYASDALKDDKEFIMELIKIDYSLFEFVSDRLKNDIELATVACELYNSNFEYISNELKQNKEFIKDLILNHDVDFYIIVSYIDIDIIREISLELVKMNPSNILLLDSERINYVCSYYTKEYMNYIIDYIKNNPEKNPKRIMQNNDPLILYIDKKVNGSKRQRT